MADNLGVPDYNGATDRMFAQRTSIALQSLGAQLRSDMTQIQANKEVKKLGQVLSQLEPRSSTFPTDLMSAAIAHPLGVQHPVGQMALTTLGAAHKAWAAENLVDKRLAAQDARPSYGAGPRGMVYNRRTGDVTRGPDYPPMPEKETPIQREEREKRMIDYRAKNRAGRLQKVLNGDGTVAYFIDPDTRETIMPEDMGAPETTPRPVAQRKVGVKDVEYLNSLTDELLSTEARLTKERAKTKTMGFGGPDQAQITRLEAQVKATQEKVKLATEALGVGKTRPLDIETAKVLLKEAGGDKAKARELAIARGYSL